MARGCGEEWETKVRRTKHVCGRKDCVDGEEQS